MFYSQGELCFRGRNIMMGYMACNEMGQAHVQEIMKKNGETIDSQGWLHSGDKGMITEAGMVKITGRYKELIIGEGGENIAPVPIEDSVKKACDGVAEIMMVGDKRKYNVALVTLKAGQSEPPPHPGRGPRPHGAGFAELHARAGSVTLTLLPALLGVGASPGPWRARARACVRVRARALSCAGLSVGRTCARHSCVRLRDVLPISEFAFAGLVGRLGPPKMRSRRIPMQGTPSAGRRIPEPLFNTLVGIRILIKPMYSVY